MTGYTTDWETIGISGSIEKADRTKWTVDEIWAFNDHLIDMCEEYGYRFGGGVGPERESLRSTLTNPSSDPEEDRDE